MSKYLFVCAFLISQMNLAQNNAGSQLLKTPSKVAERVFIHFNSSFFLPGETLEYALYNLNAENHTESEVSKIAHVVLLDSERKPVFQHTLDLDAGAAYSDFLIPSSLPSGTYKLMGYTKWMKNYNQSGIFMADIFILNPYLQQESGKILRDENFVQQNANIQETPGNKSEAFGIGLDRETAGLREKLNLMLDLSNEKLMDARISLSIRKLDSTVLIEPARAVDISEKGPGAFSFKNLPEYRGPIIKGQVLMNDQPVTKKLNLSFSVPKRADKFRIYSTDQKGYFNFQVSDLVDFSEANLKVISGESRDYQIRLDSMNMIQNPIEFPAIPLTNLDEKSLSERIVHHQIEQYYNAVKSDSVIQYPSGKVFYGNKATKYFLDDYTRFNTMAETFVEIINFVSFKNVDDKKEVKISDFQNPNATGGVPLILVDGIAVQDHMTVYNLNPNTVESISVLIDKYYYGPAFYQGVLDIRTKNETFDNPEKGYELQLQPVEKQKSYYSPDYSTEKNYDLSRIPDYRYQLLWMPEVRSNQIEFYTSDISGFFEVRIEGFLSNGKPVSLRKLFQVSEKL